MYNPAAPQFLRAHPDAVDYVEVTSDMFWTDHGPRADVRFVYLESWIDTLEWVASRWPLAAHNVGLSIGSAGGLDEAYVAHLASWLRRYPFAWHSDHLSYATVRGAAGADQSVGIAAPLPFDHEVLDLVVERARHVQAVTGLPFLLENGVYYVAMPEQELEEQAFLNQLAARSSCNLLLDIHNLYVNARNHGFDPFAFLDRLNLDRVHEIHVAGGTVFDGMYTDSHSGPCPEIVWELLEHALPRLTKLRGITFEFHDSYFPRFGNEGILEQLGRARTILGRSDAAAAA